MGILKEPPRPGSYKFVAQMIRHLNSDIPQLFSSYNETAQSRLVTFNGEARHTIFLKNESALQRAQKLGWRDITAQFLEMVNETTPKPSTAGQRHILETLANMNAGWHGKVEIVEQATDLPDSEWRTAIKYLEKKGLVECNIDKRRRAIASNRRYQYKITDAGRLALEM